MRKRLFFAILQDISHKNDIMKKILLLAMIIGIAACGKSDDELAMEKYESADSAYKAGDHALALAYIDTLNAKYPKQVNARKKAKIIELNIKIAEQRSNLQTADSMLRISQEIFNNSQSDFNFEKNEKYQSEGNFTVKGQETLRIANRTMLKPYITEKGDLQIHSQCVGRTGHTRISVSSGDRQEDSEEIAKGNAFNHIYTAGETSHQTLVIRQNADKIADLVAENASANIKVTLLDANGKAMTSYMMSQQDKNAIVKAADLSKKLKTLMEYKHQRDVAERKIEVFLHSLAQYEADENLDKKEK